MRRFTKLFIFMLACVMLTACSSKKEEEVKEIKVDITEAERVADDEIVAVVGDKEVDGKTYNTFYNHEKKIAVSRQMQDEEVDLDKVKELTLDRIINDLIIEEMANEQGIEVTAGEVEESFKELKRLGKSDYRNFVQQFDYTDDDVRHLLYIEELTRRYMESNIVDITVTEEEIEALYEEVAERAGEEEIPDYEESKDFLKNDIHVSKSKEELEKRMNEYRDSITIEINI